MSAREEAPAGEYQAGAEETREQTDRNGSAPGDSRNGASESRYVILDVSGEHVATHVRQDYVDADGVKHTRMWWESPDGTPGLGGLRSADLPLYGMERLADRDAEPVIVVEGERAAAGLIALGVLAVGTVTGAGATPSDDVLRWLLGRDVVVWPDHDDPGRQHMARIAAALHRLGGRVCLLRWSGAIEPGDDAADYVDRGGTREELLALVEAAEPWTPDGPADTADDWGPLVPLDHARELPSMPLDALPPWLRDMATHTARAYQVPPEFPALYALALVSGAIAGRYVVQVRPGWRMPPTLYVLIPLPPSERKTPVIHALAEPLRAYEREMAEAIATARRDALARVKQLRAVEEAALRRVARPPKGTSAEEAARAHSDASRALDEAIAQVPPEARMLVEYATPEALAERMCDWDDRQIILSDEGAGVLAMTGRYSRWGGAHLDLLLRGYDGEPYTPARVTRVVRPMHAATLTIALGAQPAAIVELLRHAPEIRERGLLARFVAALPRPMVGRRKIRMAPVPASVADKYARRMRALLDVGDQYEDGRLRPRVLRMSRAADDVIADLERVLEPALGRGGRLERIAAWAGKLAGQAGRIAAILHAADHAGGTLPGEIPAATAERAVASARACIPHTEALEDMLAAAPELEGGRRIAEWLHRHGHPVVTDREILRATRGAVCLATAEQRDAALRLLAGHGYVRRAVPDTAGGRRPSPRWEVRPAWLASRCGVREYTDNMDDIAAGDGGGGVGSDSVHIVHGVAESAIDACPDDDLEAALAGARDGGRQ